MTRATTLGRAILWTILVLVESCNRGPTPLFRNLSARQTGVTFANTITTTDSMNVQTDVYIYNGAGVAVGDIDHDGLPDLFFAGNMVSSRLYRNTGHMRFEDITEKAGVKTTRWCTGVTMVDINDDGYLDIYVSVSGAPWSQGKDRANLLFINNGNGTFREAAAEYGIADTGFTTHAVFLDYDGDGDLDLFLLNNSPEDFARGAAAQHPAQLHAASPASWNKLYRNNGNGTFTDVSDQAGILRQLGYGLGVAVADVNGDGRPDIYVSNDVTPNDVLYVNNGDGTFTDKAATWLKHASVAGMGVDIADFNNDGRPDILQVDMMPAALSAQKRMSGYLTYGSRMDTRNRGYRDDFDVNSLQLSNGVTPEGDLRFSDIAHLAGVAHTDWSWSPLFADFDNDGWKDIFISNGYPKAVNDLDYQTAVFAANRVGDRRRALRYLRELYAYAVPNYVFRNNGDLTFSDETSAWGLTQPGFSYGAAYADLDNDGQLDLVINRIDAPALIYENTLPRDAAHHWLEVKLDGQSPNTGGIGAQLILTAGGKTQYLYHSPYRGYLSKVDDREHFGLGSSARVDSLEVIWPDGYRQLLADFKADTLLVVRRVPGVGNRVPTGGAATRYPSAGTRRPLFTPLESSRAPRYQDTAKGQDNDDVVQPLLPYSLSSHGPPLAVADVNGDGLDDLFIGGGPGSPRKLFLQQRDGSFVDASRGQPWAADTAFEDWGAAFFDADGDSRPDLYIASGGYRLVPESPLLQDRLYINQGNGRFARATGSLPPIATTTAAIAAGDFTGDGKPDLFVGGRLAERNYPAPARSYLLRNDGGKFTDVTAEWCPELLQPGGMITAAVWIDFDGDGKLDLVTAGEWMPLQFYRNDGHRLANVTAQMGLPPTRGWWFSLASGDFNHDGRPDLVAGNLGLNFFYTTSDSSRFGVYAGDFAHHRASDIVLTKEIGGVEYPLFGLGFLGREIYPLTVRYPSYAAFSAATMGQVFDSAQLHRALHYQADTFASLYLQNNGNGTFTASPLPTPAQIAPIRGIVVDDVDGDGNLDVIVAGNLYDFEPNTPRADAGNGLWLRGDGHGHFTPVLPAASGFLAPWDVTGLALLKSPARRTVIVANNGDSLRAFLIRRR